jgi:hypothetical protein
MNSANDLARMVPGFDFLQNLMKGAGASLPGVQGFGQWIAPTLDPEEIEKRIQELKTVQFWLEQNARLLGTTIQALEVQRMTLATLKTMNLPMTELRDALKARTPEPEVAPEPEPQEAPAPPPAPRKGAASKAAEAKAPAIDPMQWWGALTQQFTELATQAVKDSTADAARKLAGAAVKEGIASAGKTLQKAASLPANVARKAARKATARPRKT